MWRDSHFERSHFAKGVAIGVDGKSLSCLGDRSLACLGGFELLAESSDFRGGIDPIRIVDPFGGSASYPLSHNTNSAFGVCDLPTQVV